MSLTNPNTPVSQQDLQDFYHKILPYMGGGSGGGGGHTIEDSEGTDLTQRDTLQFGEGFLAEDDDTNEKTVISPDIMQSGDMDDVITPLPSVQPRYHKYSTTEQVVGEWIDGKPLYQRVFTGTATANTTNTIASDVTGIDSIISMVGAIKYNSTPSWVPISYVASGSDCETMYLSNGSLYCMGKYGGDVIIVIEYTKTTS